MEGVIGKAPSHSLPLGRTIRIIARLLGRLPHTLVEGFLHQLPEMRRPSCSSLRRALTFGFCFRPFQLTDDPRTR